ncbi:unnamed protein product [Sphagnum balticum]
MSSSDDSDNAHERQAKERRNRTAAIVERLWQREVCWPEHNAEGIRRDYFRVANPGMPCVAGVCCANVFM